MSMLSGAGGICVGLAALGEMCIRDRGNTNRVFFGQIKRAFKISGIAGYEKNFGISIH